MIELRNFLLGACGTLGLLEVTNSENMLAPDSDPEAMLMKTVITLFVGGLSTLLTHLFKKQQQPTQPKRKAKTRKRQSSQRSKNLKQ